LSLERSIIAWKSYFFLGHIVTLFLYFAIPILFKAPKKKKKQM